LPSSAHKESKEKFIARNPVAESAAETTLDEVVQLRGRRESIWAAVDEGTEAKVIQVFMIVRSQRLIGQLTRTVTDKDARLMDDARMGRAHDVPKGFISSAKTALNNGFVDGTGRKHVWGLEELGNIQGPRVKAVTEAARDIIGGGITTRESTGVARVGSEAEVRVAVVAIGHAMSDENHVPRPDSTGRDAKTLWGHLEETFPISG
jgi:hypothetical protein